MAGSSNRVNIVLDETRALKLRRLAERTNTNPGTIARSLLSTALDEADPDPRTITDLLDRIDGAWEDAVAGRAEIVAGHGTLAGRSLTRGHGGRVASCDPQPRAPHRDSCIAWIDQDPVPAIDRAPGPIPAARCATLGALGGIPLHPRPMALDDRRLRVRRSGRPRGDRHDPRRPFRPRRHQRSLTTATAPTLAVSRPDRRARRGGEGAPGHFR